MRVAFWIVAIVLAVFYLYAGGMKLVRNQEQLQPMMAWAGTAIPMAGVRAIGIVAVVGALIVLAALAVWFSAASG